MILLQLLYIILAILGIGFLVFIHELGHYFMAKRSGMTVEVFSIGFGKPLYSWMRGKVRWQIAALPFGGYVKIKGMHEEKKGVDPHQIKDGFFGKKPSDRIKVALAGPIVNLVFALFAFSLLFFLGGRLKSFSEFTHRIGAVDPASTLFQEGVRPGDEIETLDGVAFQGIKELQYLALTRKENLSISGNKIDYYSGNKTPFSYELSSYRQRNNPDFSSIGIQAPASFLIFTAQDPSILENSSLVGSGMSTGDRIVFIDGELIFSVPQLVSVLNSDFVFLTIQRGQEIFQTRVPRTRIESLALSASQRGEIDDWRREVGLDTHLSSLFFIPYDLRTDGVVEKPINFIDPKEQKQAFKPCYRCHYFSSLKSGDRILAIGGKRVTSSYEILNLLQTKLVAIVVATNQLEGPVPLWKQADALFDQTLDSNELQELVSHIGVEGASPSQGNLKLLSPVELKTLSQIQLASKQADLWKKAIEKEKEKISKIKDTELRSARLVDLEREKERFALGIPLQDRKVIYNPNPLALFKDTLLEIQRTLVSVIVGYVSPKYLSGPIGMIQLVQISWGLGVKEALFWLGLISLNLGILNLLPLPVLDGGHIVFSLVEWVTGRKIRIKTMERLIIPFFCLLVAFLLYVSFHDLLRLFSF